VIPAAALAAGEPDPAFNGIGYRVGTVAEGTMFNNVENRVPMVVQSDGRIVVGGSRGGFMTLVRYNTNGTIDTTFGVNGFATRQFHGTPALSPGNSGAVAMTLDGTGPTANIVVAGFGGSQSMVAARFTANGTFAGATVCYAPHLIDYTARGLALRGANVILVGYARDRHPAFADPVGPSVMYGQRAIVTLPATATATATGCGGYIEQQGSTGVVIDGLTHAGVVTDATLGGRYYEGVAATAANYTVASTTGPDGAAWVQRFAGGGAGALDATFNGTGRVLVPAVDFHAIRLAGDGSAYVAGEAVAATAADRQMVVARILATGGYGAFGSGGIARIRVGGGNNTGEALVLQGPNVIVGGTANLAARASFGIARLTAAGAPDPTFGTGGQTATPIGTPQVNAYITGMGLSGDLVAVSGRASDPAGVAVIAGRYYHTGAPPPPPPPVATTSSADQITLSTARVSGTVNANGTASSWWIEYGTTTAYGARTPTQPLAASTLDVDVQAVVSGLAAGTTYHARVVATSTQGTDPGDDVTFTTLGVAAPPAPTTPAAPAPAATTGGTTTTVRKNAKKRQCVVPKVTGKKLNKARTTVYARGCKVQVKYLKSSKAKNTVLAQSRKAGKKLGFRAVVRLTVATKAVPKKS
jgi:uncharacterized delta-60 repeat protein